MSSTSHPFLISGKLSSLQRACILLLLYGTACALSWWFAYELRFDFSPDASVMEQCLSLMPGVIALKLLLLLALGQFGSLLSYFSLPDAEKVFGATLVVAIVLYSVRFFTGDAWSAPRAVVLSDFILSFAALCTLRIGLRRIREFFQQGASGGSRARKVRRIGVIGAGDVGAALVKDLLTRPGLGMKAVAFGDDNSKKWRTSIHGVPVIGSPEYLVERARQLEFDEMVIAMPSAPAKRVRELVALLNKQRIKFELVPSMEQLVNGRVRVSQLRQVEVEDLLGRQSVDLEADRIHRLVSSKTVLVTGGGGSIGSELCLQIRGYTPKLLVIVEQCEVQIFQIEQKLAELGAGATCIAMVADVLDGERMRAIFDRYRPQVVFHAAAHKHVPLMEHQPGEALQNNTIATARLADLSLEFGVEHFVQISTDKAINPTSVMGATKRLAELYLQSLAERHPHKTRFMAVRFGNVLGSSGSVIPTFKQQIAKGGPVTVTHAEVTRYFMTVHEAVGLVLQSAAQGQGGEIFVLDMGSPMKIADLARQMIQLSGLEPDFDIEIKFTGLRPGEKLYEELHHRTENMVATEHPKIMRFVCAPFPYDELREKLDRLWKDARGMEPAQIKLEIQKIVPEYTPYLPQR